MISLDLDRAVETFAQARRPHRRPRGGVRDPRPEHARTGAALRGAARAAAQRRPVLHERITGELISSEIEIISGVGGDLHDALARQRERRRRLFALAAAHGVRARRDRHPSVGRLPRAADHRHRALPPRRGGPEVRGLAQQHLQPARARRRARHRPRGARRATGCARCCRCCWRSPPTRRSWTAATRACTRRARRASPRASRAAASPTRSAAGAAYREYIEFLVRTQLDRRVHPGLVVGAAALQLRHRRGADLRRAGDARRSPRRWRR